MPTRILVLDDEPAIQHLLSRLLESAGYQVDTLKDPLAAFEVIRSGAYALVITNSVMHGPAGAKLVARMRREHPTLPVLHLDDQSHPQVPEFPPDVTTLTKPFHHDVLLEAVRELVGGRPRGEVEM
jgi:DNA-binding response OmpR family regulator